MKIEIDRFLLFTFGGIAVLIFAVSGLMFIALSKSKSYSQSEMNCEKSFVMLNEVKHLGCAHVDVHEILHVRSG